MATAIQNKFHWNDETSSYERVDRTQEYRGHKIESITYHFEGADYWDNHREYRVTFPSGRTALFGINKRGGNIKNLKEWIDFNIKYDRKEHL